jgi:hypothetical protein
MIRIVAIGLLTVLLLQNIFLFRSPSREGVARRFLVLSLLIVVYLAGIASYPIFYLGRFPTPLLEVLLSVGIYICLGFLIPLSGVFFVRAILVWVYLFLSLLGYKELPLAPDTLLWSSHLVFLILAFYLMGEIAVLAFLFFLKERALRSVPRTQLVHWLPSLEGIERGIRYLRRISLFAIGAGMMSGIALAELRRKMFLDFYTLALPMLFLFLLGFEFYAGRRKRWGGRFATIAMIFGAVFILVWMIKWLNLVPHGAFPP